MSEATAIRGKAPASLFSAAGKLAVTIVAMAEDGAVLACADQPPCGSFAFLVRNGHKLPAIVSWATDAQIGLTFESPIAPERLLALAMPVRGALSRAAASSAAPGQPIAMPLAA